MSDELSTVPVARQLADAMNRRSWLEFEDLIDPSAVFVDHRAASWGTLDRKGYVEITRQLPEMVPNVVLSVPEPVHLSGSRGVFVLSATGSTQAGSEVEFAWAIVGEFVGGRVRRLEYFDGDQVPDALARLDELDHT